MSNIGEVRLMRVTEVEEFPAIKKAVNDGIAEGLHRLYAETSEPTYLEAQEYVIRHIKSRLDALLTWNHGPGELKEASK